MKYVVLDLDDVVMDFSGTLVEAFNNYNKTNIKKEHIIRYNFNELSFKQGDMVIPGQELDKFFSFFEGEIYSTCPVLVPSLLAIQALMADGCHVVLMTARSKDFTKQTTFSLFKNQLPNVELIMGATNKAESVLNLMLEYGTPPILFVDDRPEHVEMVRALNLNIGCYIVDMPHNKEYKGVPRIAKLSDIPMSKVWEYKSGVLVGNFAKTTLASGSRPLCI